MVHRPKISGGKREKVKTLAKRGATEGEREAATAALSRLPAERPERRRLSDAMVRSLAAPNVGNRVYYDAPNARGNGYTAGFGLRVTASGHRAFVLNYRSKSGREGRITIGSAPEWTLTAARERAKELKRAIDGGADPAREDRERREADNVNDLAERFIEEHVSTKRPSTQVEYKRVVNQYIKPEWGTLKVADVDSAHVDKLHRKIGKDAPIQANRTIAVASKMFSLAVRWKLRTDNPCKGAIDRNDEAPRNRYLTDAELLRLRKALDEYENEDAANAIRLMLLTGARRGETLRARWADFDLQGDKPKWTKPGATTKQRTEHRLPLSTPAVELLKRMRADDPKAEYVFGGRVDENGKLLGKTKTPHRVALKTAWHEIRKAAKIPDVRIHDLRHSHASALINSGVPLAVVGGLLGHTRAETTRRYAHLFDDVLRDAAERGGAKLK